jgi:hypothetical protein
VKVPAEVRPYLNRREVVRSLHTADKVEARLRASARYMDREQIEALVAQTLDAELHEVEVRLALGLMG